MSILNGGFHGSPRPSQYLGGGVYFYTCLEYAYKWNYDHLKDQSSGAISFNDVRSKYAILTADINDRRIFDLDTPEHKMVFLDIREKSYEFIRSYIEKSGDNYTEGAILNLMFMKMGFSKSFDIVAATFSKRMNGGYDISLGKMRLNFIPQRIICVRNTDAINGKPRVCNIDGKREHLEKSIDNLY